MINPAVRAKLSNLACYGENGKTVGSILRATPDTVIGALQNSDEYKVLAKLAYQHPDMLINGVKIAAQFAGAKHAILIVPHEKYLTPLSKIAYASGVELIVTEFINVREYKKAVFLHFVTLINISRILAGEMPCIFVSTVDELINEIPFGTKLNALISGEGIKAVLIDHKVYQPVVLEKEISGEFNFGSGRISGIKNTECIVQVILEETSKFREMSCGICTFCREGSFQLETNLKSLKKPGTKSDQLELMREIGEAMICSNMCSVGAKAALPVLTGLELFESEIRSHCGRGTCPTGNCEAFLNVFIDPRKCVGCGDCIDVCPEDCIEGKSGFISMIDEFDCVKCGKCVKVCQHGAAQFASGRVPKLPDKLTKIGRF